jgi:hypothetical protein
MNSSSKTSPYADFRRIGALPKYDTAYNLAVSVASLVAAPVLSVWVIFFLSSESLVTLPLIHIQLLGSDAKFLGVILSILLLAFGAVGLYRYLWPLPAYDHLPVEHQRLYGLEKSTSRRTPTKSKSRASRSSSRRTTPSQQDIFSYGQHTPRVAERLDSYVFRVVMNILL